MPAGLVRVPSCGMDRGRMPGFDREVASIAPSVSSVIPVVAERSGGRRSTSPPAKLSARFWGLDLAKTLPRVLSRDGVEAVPGELGRVCEFLAEAFPTFSEGELDAAPDPRMVEAKRDYLCRVSDLIELRHEGRTVGAIVGAPEDWSSYYVRILAVSPAYQRPGLTRRFARECLLEPLAAHGVERVVADTWPTNIAMSRGFTEMHFHVTGHLLSERWGALVRYTKFLDPVREAAFERRFAAALPSRPGRRTP
jgi:hypothetical protein